MSAGLQGLEAMQKTLNATKDKIEKRASAAGINAGLVPLVRAMRAAVNASSASSELKRAARKTLAKRLKKSADGRKYGKAGFAVGKGTENKRNAAHERSVYGQGGAKLVGGVGISASNVHWAVLGTKARKWKKTGKSTGSMPSYLAGLLRKAASSASSAMLEAARKKSAQVLAREVAKQAKKGLIK